MAHSSRTVRVFISSTFSDMHAEREELVKRVFPQLRKLCEQRGVTWGEVDLRWGVTDEQKAEGKVLPVCLEEIHRCRPYFIGLLGERYGWVPDEIPQETVQREPWLAQHRERSVTELEVLHGVLNNPQMADHAFFYFRSPAFIDSLPSEKQARYQEVPSEEEVDKYGRDESERRAAERRHKLAALKDRLRDSGLPIREDYPDPRSLGELVLEDLTSVIDRLFPAGSEPDPLDREAAEHEAYAVSRAQVYIEHKGYFDHLDEHADGNGPPLVVLGESGVGKSALLANWALRYRERWLEESATEKDSRQSRLASWFRRKGASSHPPLLLMHFTGASPYSTDWAAMLRRIMGEFKRHFSLRDEIPGQPDELRADFASWLHMAASRARVILILDGLNQLEDRDGAPDLVWLPPYIPDSIRLILSTLPGRPLDELRKRDWPALNVAPLDEAERQEVITQYLELYRKSLKPAQVERIARANQSANPLYLRVLLEELRVYGDHATLNERIDHYLAARTVSDLYDKVLGRYEEDYEGDRPGLVRDAMSLLWAARRGLSEVEVRELLGSDGEPLPRAHWSPLYLATESSLVSRSGLIGFGHDYLRQAVRARFLPGKKDQQAAHLRLAGYFEEKELAPRKVDELPWQLARSHAWQRLYHLLTSGGFFTAAWIASEFEVKGYWVQVEENSSLRIVEAYQPVLEAPARDANFTWRVSLMLSDMGHPEEALKLRAHLADYFRSTGDKDALSTALGGQAVMLRDRGDPDAAMALLKETERICRELGNKAGLSTALGNQAVILRDRGDLDAAMALLKETERIRRELGNKDGLQRSLGNQASILYARGELDAAMALYKEDERICRELGNKDGLQRSLGNQAVILRDRGDLDAAMALLKEQERICRELGNKAGLQASVCNQALILQDRGDPDAAMALHKEGERVFRELGNKDGLQASLGNQAVILRDRGDLDAAMALLKEQERICRELGNKDGLEASLGNQASILYARGELDAAMALMKEQERICRELASKDGLSISLGSQAVILRDRGELDAAMALMKEQERICRELGNKDGLSTALGNQAVILRDRGELDAAMALHKEKERICRELGNKDGLQASLGNQASILYARGELDAAMALHKERERICRELGNKDGLAFSLASQASIVGLSMNQPRAALPLADEAYRIASSCGYASIVGQIEDIRAQIHQRLG